MSDNSAEYEIRLKDLFAGPLKNLESKMNAFEKRISDINTKAQGMGNTFASTGTIAAGVFGGIGLFQAANWAISKITEVSESVVTLGTNMEKTRITFKTLLGGDAAFADSMIKKFQKFAQETPFSTDDILKGAKKLTAFKFAVEDIIPTMSKLGDIASGLDLDFKYITWLVGHTKSLGHLNGRILNEFQNAGIDIASEIEKKKGINGDQFHKLVSKGKISFKDVDDALTSMTSKGGKFFRLNDQLAKTTFGRWERFKDTLEIIGTKMGESLNPTLNKFLDEAFEGLNRFANVNMDPIISAMTSIWEVGKKILGLFDSLSEALKPSGSDHGWLESFRRIFTALNNTLDLVIFAYNKIRGKTDESFQSFFDKKNAEEDAYMKVQEDKAAQKIHNPTGKTMADLFPEAYAPKGPKKEKSHNYDEEGATGGGSVGMEKIQSANKNVTLNITQLVGQITYEKWDATNTNEITETVKRVLLTAVNDVNLVSN